VVYPRFPQAAAMELDGEVDVVLKGGDGGAGELHGIMMKLLKVMVWLEKGRGELSTVDMGFAGEEHGRRRRSAARGEMRMQERAKWREGELLKVLDQKRKVRGHA
jgi:hypothetical protein